MVTNKTSGMLLPCGYHVQQTRYQVCVTMWLPCSTNKTSGMCYHVVTMFNKQDIRYVNVAMWLPCSTNKTSGMLVLLCGYHGYHVQQTRHQVCVTMVKNKTSGMCYHVVTMFNKQDIRYVLPCGNHGNKQDIRYMLPW